MNTDSKDQLRQKFWCDVYTGALRWDSFVPNRQPEARQIADEALKDFDARFPFIIPDGIHSF